jgi:hypothetical protein
MAIWIRNLHTPFVIDTWGCHLLPMVFSEILRVARWSLNSTNGDAAWTAAGNIVVNEPGGVGGFEVDALNPRIIYDPSGRFTSAMVTTEHMITLFGGVLDSDQNRSAWRITEYIDANNVKVDADGFNPFGWITDTQLGGRITKFDGTRLSNGAWALFDSPTPSRHQIRMYYADASNSYIGVRPMGKPYVGTGGAADTIGGTAPNMTLNISGGKFNKHMVGSTVTITGATTPANNGTFTITAVSPTGQITYTNAGGVAESFTGASFSVSAIATQVPSANGRLFSYSDTNRIRLHMYADTDVLLVYWVDQDQRYHCWFVGKLIGVVSKDTDPVVLWGYRSIEVGATWPWLWPVDMLDGAASPAVMAGYPTWWGEKNNVNDDDNFNCQFGRRVVNGGLTPMLEPYVCMANTVSVGGCLRGKIPQCRLGWKDFEKLRPMDSAGAWFHFIYGLFVPRNGSQDPIPMLPMYS